MLNLPSLSIEFFNGHIMAFNLNLKQVPPLFNMGFAKIFVDFLHRVKGVPQFLERAFCHFSQTMWASAGWLTVKV